MSYMFYDATNFNQKLNWNTLNVKNMVYIFYSSSKTGISNIGYNVANLNKELLNKSFFKK